MSWEVKTPIKAKQRVDNFSTMYDELPMCGHIAVGFGDAHFEMDGKVVWHEGTDMDFDDCLTVGEAENIAAKDPDHDWRIVLYGPLRGRTFQRQNGHWYLIEENRGFA